MSSNPEYGDVPSELSLADMGYYNVGEDDVVSELSEKGRKLLISPPGTEPESKLNNSKCKRTKNRKEVSKSSLFIHKGIEYKINNAPSYGVYKRIMHKMLDQLDVCIQKWKRVFVIRFDLRQKYYTPDNKMVSKFRKNLARRIERHYDIYELGYAWCREQEKAKQQHYHMIVFLDGDKINHHGSLKLMICDTWKSLKDGNSAFIPKHCYYNIKGTDPHDSVKAEVVERMSYLSKQRGKGYRPPQTKDYGTSRLCTPFKFDFQTGASVK